VDAAVATPLAVILNELIQNAVEHGLGDGPGTVTVELRGGDDRPVELQVHDNGPGSTPGPLPAKSAAEPLPPESTPEPLAPGIGTPEREGNPGARGAQPAVHSPRGSGFPGVQGPEGGLGLRLVRALVEEELRGQFTLTHPTGRGSIATAIIPPVERAG
jgi:two-component sensor histidine kinase